MECNWFAQQKPGVFYERGHNQADRFPGRLTFCCFARIFERPANVLLAVCY